jgi:hypothetical protein
MTKEVSPFTDRPLADSASDLQVLDVQAPTDVLLACLGLHVLPRLEPRAASDERVPVGVGNGLEIFRDSIMRTEASAMAWIVAKSV